jgi:short-subunit dehydrogenase
MPYQTAMITGASSGIGEGFARELAARGCDLILVARRAGRLEKLAAELTERVRVAAEVLPADLTDSRQLHAVAQRLSDAARPVDLLVNSAGTGTDHRFVGSPLREEEYTISLNVTALTRLCHAALPGMCQRRRGGIINVSSFAGLLPAFGHSATYGASKAFIYSLSEGLALEARGRGVHVTVTCPGYVHTDRTAATSGVPGIGWVDRAQVVRDALRAVEAGRPLAVPGAPYKVAEVLVRALPRRLVRIAARRAPG